MVIRIGSRPGSNQVVDLSNQRRGDSVTSEDSAPDLAIVKNRVRALANELIELGRERSALMTNLEPDWEGEHQASRQIANRLVAHDLAEFMLQLTAALIEVLLKILLLAVQLRGGKIGETIGFQKRPPHAVDDPLPIGLQPTFIGLLRAISVPPLDSQLASVRGGSNSLQATALPSPQIRGSGSHPEDQIWITSL